MNYNVGRDRKQMEKGGKREKQRDERKSNDNLEIERWERQWMRRGDAVFSRQERERREERETERE